METLKELAQALEAAKQAGSYSKSTGRVATAQELRAMDAELDAFMAARSARQAAVRS